MTDLMQQYYALPAVAAERQLALAQAAAGRSCAYLRCANLGGRAWAACGAGGWARQWGGWVGWEAGRTFAPLGWLDCC